MGFMDFIKKGYNVCMNSKKTIVVLDLITDRVHSRFLSATLFTILVVYVARTVLFSMFLSGMDVTIRPARIEINDSTDRTQALVLGDTLSSISLSVLDERGLGVSNRMVYCDLVPNGLPNTARGLEGTSFDYLGVYPQSQDLVTDSFLPTSLTEPKVIGCETITSSSGKAEFRFIRLENIVSGDYGLRFYVNYDVEVADETSDIVTTEKRTVYSADSISITVESTVRIVEVETQEMTVNLNEEFTMTAEVTSNTFAPIPNRAVTAVLFHKTENEQWLPQKVKDVGLPDHGKLEGTYTTTNSEGKAEFKKLKVTEAPNGIVRIGFVCEGIISKIVETHVTLPKKVANIRIISENFPTSMKEDSLLDSFQVLLVDESNAPIEGQVALARITVADGFPLQQGLSMWTAFELNPEASSAFEYIGSTKRLRNYFSTKSDADGIATFENLGFTRNGPSGQYSIDFIVGDAHSNDISIELTTAVNKIEFYDSTTAPDVLITSPGIHSLNPNGSGISLRVGTLNEDSTFTPAMGKFAVMQVVSDSEYLLNIANLDGHFGTCSTPEECSVHGFYATTYPSMAGIFSNQNGVLDYSDIETQGWNIRTSKKQQQYARARFFVDGVASAWTNRFEVVNLTPMTDFINCAGLIPDSNEERYATLSRGDKLPKTKYTGIDAYNRPLGDAASGVDIANVQSKTEGHRFLAGMNGPLAIGGKEAFMSYSLIANTFGEAVPYSSSLVKDYAPNLDSSPVLFANDGSIEMQDLEISVAMDSFFSILDTVHIKPGYSVIGTCPHQFNICTKSLGISDSARETECKRICTEGTDACKTACEETTANIPTIEGIDMDLSVGKIFEICGEEYKYCVEATTTSEDNFQWQCTAPPRHFALKSDLVVETVSGPTSCEVSKNCETFIAEVKDMNGQPVVGQKVSLRPVIDANAEFFPSYLADDSPFNDNWAIAGRSSIWAIRPETSWNGCLSGCEATTDASGQASFTPLISATRPGKYYFYPEADGKAGMVFEPTTFANPVAKIEPLESSLNDYTCPTALASKTCLNNCSGHGSCVCGMCICDSFWDSKHDCSVKRGNNDNPIGEPLPTVTLFQGSSTATSLLGSVKVTDSNNLPVSDVTVAAWAVACEDEEDVSLESRFDEDVFIGHVDFTDTDDRCPSPEYTVSKTDMLLSSPSGLDGIATFPSDLSFTSGASQCLQFVYTFYGTDTGGFGRTVDVFEGAIVSEPGYKFRLVNPVSALSLTTTPAIMGAPGRELSQTPELTVVLSEGYTLSDYLLECDTTVFNPETGSFVDRCEAADSKSSFIVEASATNMQGENVPLVTVGSTNACARIDSDTNTVKFDKLSFPDKYFTRSIAMTQDYSHLLNGDYYLSYETRGVRFTNTTERIEVNNIADVIVLINSVDDMVVGEPASFTVKATLDDGTPLRNVIVSVGMKIEKGLLGEMKTLSDNTDNDGYVTFSGIEFVSGSTGDYTLEFYSGGAILEHPIKLRNPVTGIVATDKDWLTGLHLSPLTSFEAVATRTKKKTIRLAITTDLMLTGKIPILSTFYKKPFDWDTRCGLNQTACLTEMTPIEDLELTLGGDAFIDWTSITCGIPCVADVTFDTLTITGGSDSMDLILFFSMLGEPSNFIKVDFITFADEYKFKLSDLTDNMWFPLFIISPMFVANSLYISFKWRFVSLMTGFATVILMITRASDFIDETDDLSKYFEGDGITYLQIMDKTLVVLLVIAVLYLLMMIYDHLKDEVEYRKMRRMGQIPNMKAKAGHFEDKINDQNDYVRERLPKQITPLLKGGSLSRMAKLALFEVFQRNSNAEEASFAAKQLKRLSAIKQTVYDIISKIFGKSTITEDVDMMFDGAGLLPKEHLKKHVSTLLKVNLGSVVIKSDQVPKPLIIETVLKRFTMYGPYTLMLDYKRLGVGNGQYNPMATGLINIKADAAPMLRARLDEMMSGDTLPTRTFIELLCPHLASMVNDCPQDGYDAETFLALHEARMRSFVCADGLFCDRVCYAEMGVLGYDHTLNLKVLDKHNRFTNEATKVMKENIEGYCKKNKKADVKHLTYEETRKLFKDGKIVCLAKDKFEELIKFTGDKFDHNALMLLFMQRYQNPELAVRSFAHNIHANDLRFRDVRYSTECFFYPQRLLVAFVLSLTVACFMGMLTHHGAVSLKTFINDKYDDAIEYQNSFIFSMQQFVEDSAMHTISSIESQLLDTAGLSTSGMVEHLKATAPSGIPDSVVDQLYQPEIIDDVIKSYVNERFNSIGNGTSILSATSGIFGSELGILNSGQDNFLGEISLEKFRDILDDINEYGESAVLAGSIMAYAVMLLVWLQVLKTYRKRIFEARHGRYTLVWENNNITKSVSYIGIQMASCALGFLMFFLPMCALLLVVALEPLRSFIWSQFYTMLPSLLTLGLLVVIAQSLIVKKWLTGGDFVRYHRLYMLLELFFTFFNLFKGFFVSAIRLIMSVLFFGVTFMRADVSQLPLESEHKDPVTAAYNGMLMLDMQNNHPMKSVFIRLLVTFRKNRKRLDNIIKLKRGLLKEFKPQFVSKSKDHLAKARFQDDDDRDDGLKEALKKFNPLRKSTKLAKAKGDDKLVASTFIMNPLQEAMNSTDSVLMKSKAIDMFSISNERMLGMFKETLQKVTYNTLTNEEIRLLLLYFGKDLLFSYSLFQTNEQRTLRNRFQLLVMMNTYKSLLHMRNSDRSDDDFGQKFREMGGAFTSDGPMGLGDRSD
eukprot:TRINITY_DN3875_c0_g1_i1.p1 TRINITY_DN3875_c0_g1~~TRINITY_DN3875_c0_g1_i1.p1  ORF type:complete len:2721 (+),score=949.87 TRINITY_DN3875_c0_g1_i1:227-8389(+)